MNEFQNEDGEGETQYDTSQEKKLENQKKKLQKKELYEWMHDVIHEAMRNDAEKHHCVFVVYILKNISYAGEMLRFYLTQFIFHVQHPPFFVNQTKCQPMENE